MDINLKPFTKTVQRSLRHGYLTALQNFQKTLSLNTGFSLATIENGGKVLVQYSHPKDEFHSFIIQNQELLLDLIKDKHSGFRVLKCVGGLTFMSNPIIIKDKLFGFVLAGPVVEVPPNNQQIKELNRAIGLSAEDIRHAVNVHPAPVPLDLTRGKELTISLADITAQIIHVQQLQETQVTTMSSLYDASTAIGRYLELEKILPTVLEKAIELMQSGTGSLTLLDKSHMQLIYNEEPGAPINFVNRITCDKEFQDWICDNGKAKISEDPDGSTWIGVPLIVNNVCAGSVKLAPRPNGERYTEGDLNTLGIMAKQASSAIEKAQVHSQAVRQYRELEALQKVGLSLNSSVDVPKTLKQVLDHACELLDAKTSSIMLLEPDGRHLTIRQARGLSEEVIKSTRVKIGERISGRVALYGKAIQMSKGFGDKGDETEASLCVPLKVDDKVIGVLNVRGHSQSEEFSNEDLNLATRLASMSAAAIENAELHNKLQQLFVESITALANSIDARDQYTRGHSERVAAYCIIMGNKLCYSERELWDLRNAALLHDIGKIKIRDNILNKPDKLSPEEYNEMQKHPVYGAGIMMPVKTFKPLIPYIQHHHEWYNGEGYPDHKMGDEIPFCARIICIADSFDAMTSDRPYRKGMNPRKAVDILIKDAGTQFDPYIVNVFVKLFNEGKIEPIINKMQSRNLGVSRNIITSPEGGMAMVWKKKASSEDNEIVADVAGKTGVGPKPKTSA